MSDLTQHSETPIPVVVVVAVVVVVVVVDVRLPLREGATSDYWL